jgi:nicotinate-nucleotide adenylyltransferase
VLLVPAAANPLKGRAVATAPQRLEMCRLATAGSTLFEVSDVELNRQPPSYTIHTVEELRRQGGRDEGFGVVIGADMIHDLPRWHRVEDLLDAARMIVVPRPPQSADGVRRELAKLEGKLPARHVDAMRQGVVQTPLIDISATDIRRRVRAGLSVDYLTPPEIIEFIGTCKLYGE